MVRVTILLNRASGGLEFSFEVNAQTEIKNGSVVC